MAYNDRKAMSLIGASLALIGALSLSACNNKDKASTPTATATTSAIASGSAVDDPTAAPSEANAADDMHNRMENDQRQARDHDSMRMGPGNHPMGPGMNGAASPTPSPQSTDQGGGMQHM